MQKIRYIKIVGGGESRESQGSRSRDTIMSPARLPRDKQQFESVL